MTDHDKNWGEAIAYCEGLWKDWAREDPKNRRWVVRVPGQSAWTIASSREEAETERELANRVCQPGHQVFPYPGN